MAKVNFNKLTRGQPLTPGMVWNNLSQAATALSGNISKDQRTENRSVFSVVLHRVRHSDAIFNGYSNNPYGNLRPEQFIFKLPVWQEFFDTDFFSSADTPEIVLESISISFDCMNQNKPIRLDNGLPSTSTSDTFESPLEVTIEAGRSGGKAVIPNQTLNLTNEKIVNRPNPALTANIGANIGAYDFLSIIIESPIDIDYSTLPAQAVGAVTGIDNLVVHARFSAPIVQRDNATYSVRPQNVPLSHECARSFAANVLVPPTAGNSILATSTNLNGVQDAFEQIDRQVRNGLLGGLTRDSERRGRAESLLEDQGYFCLTVPLFNVPEDEGISLWRTATDAAKVYNSASGYCRRNLDLPNSVNPGRGHNSFMDAAVIPILAPGTIHHIGVFWDKMFLDGQVSTYRVHMDLGVALGCKVRAAEANYTQISYVGAKDVSYAANNGYINHFFAPIAFSTAAFPSVPLGVGYVPQGRPFYFGTEMDATGGALRGGVADALNPGAVEGNPKTDGTEQFIEIRCNINLYDTAAAAYLDINTGTAEGTIGNGSGVFVCIYGKQALVE